MSAKSPGKIVATILRCCCFIAESQPLRWKYYSPQRIQTIHKSQNSNMKSLTTILVAIAILFAAPAMSFAGKGKSKGGTHGKVTAVDSTSITVTSKKSGESTTFKIDGSTTVTFNGETGKHASDLTVGMKASITPGTTADTAGTITATSKGKGRKAKTTTTTS